MLSPWCIKQALRFAFDVFRQNPNSTFITLASPQKDMCVCTKSLISLNFLGSLPGTATVLCYSVYRARQNRAFRQGNSIAAVNLQC